MDLGMNQINHYKFLQSYIFKCMSKWNKVKLSYTKNQTQIIILAKILQK